MGRRAEHYLWPPGAIECPECSYDGTYYADDGETFRVVLLEEQRHAVLGVDDTAREHMHVALAERTALTDYRESEIQCMACYHTFEMPRHLIPEIEDADSWDQHMHKMVDGHLEYLRGQVLELGCDIERHPHFRVQEGARCEIEEWDSAVCYLKLREHYPELDEWDNCIIIDVEADGPAACSDLLRLRPAPDFAQRTRPSKPPSCQDCGAPATEGGSHDMDGLAFQRCAPCDDAHTAAHKERFERVKAGVAEALTRPRRRTAPARATVMPTPWDPEPDV